MAYGKRSRKSRRPSRKLYKKKYKVSVGKILDKKINTAVERRMVEVSKAEIAKSQPPNKIFRRFMYAEYDADTNEFDSETVFDWDGDVVHVAQIPIIDNSTQVAVAPGEDLALNPSIPEYYRGDNVIAPSQPQNGYRENSTIFIKNISLQMKIWMSPLTDNRTLTGTTNVQRYENEFNHVTFYWELVQLTQEQNEVTQWYPAFKDVVRRKTFGYSARLDFEEALETGYTHKKVLLRGSRTLRQSRETKKEVNVNIYHKCNIRYQFHALSQNGQNLIGKKIFLCCYADVPSSAPSIYKPHVAMCCKIGYKDL